MADKYKEICEQVRQSLVVSLAGLKELTGGFEGSDAWYIAGREAAYQDTLDFLEGALEKIPEGPLPEEGGHQCSCSTPCETCKHEK